MTPAEIRAREKQNRHREGWMVCMLLTVCVSKRRLPEELLELALLAKHSREFREMSVADFERILHRAQRDLHHGPEQLIEDLSRLLDDETSRFKAIEFASQVASATGYIRRNELAFLFRLKSILNIDRTLWKECLENAVKRLTRYATMAIVAVILNQETTWKISVIERILNEWRFSRLFTDDEPHELQQYMLMISRQIDRIDNDEELTKFCETIKFAGRFLKDSELSADCFRIISLTLLTEFPPAPNRIQLVRFVGDTIGLDALEMEEIMADAISTP